jgi:beta-galactosidase GanA
MRRFCSLLLCWSAAALVAGADSQVPHLRRQGSATQLIVDGRPFLVRGGELGNSTATNPAYLEPFWPRFTALNMNTVLAPVYWDLVEPDEGRFDFAAVDQLIGQAREHQMRLVLLWFGSWKNSMSCYAPAWVKRDARRFPRRPTSTARRRRCSRRSRPRIATATHGPLRRC